MLKQYCWYQRILIILGLTSLIAATIYVIVVYGRIDAEIPTHFNSLGEADAYGSKASLFVPLIIGWVIYLLMVTIGAFPSVWNTGVTVTEKNREKVYYILRTMLSILTFAIAAFFSYTVYCTAQGENLSKFSLPLFLILIFGTIVISIVRLVKNK